MYKVYWLLYELYFNDYCNDATIVDITVIPIIADKLSQAQNCIVLIMYQFKQSGKYQWGWLEIMQYHPDIYCNLDQLQFAASIIESCEFCLKCVLCISVYV